MWHKDVQNQAGEQLWAVNPITSCAQSLLISPRGPSKTAMRSWWFFEVLGSSQRWSPNCNTFTIPECVARVPVSLCGPGVWGCVRSTLRLRPQLSATVRNRPQSFARLLYGRASGKFCRRCHFWRFQTSRCFVSRGRRGTLWHSDVFCNVSKVVLCGRRNTFATFSEDALQFSWQAQHFGRVHRHFAWQAQHFRRVAFRVFCKSPWQGRQGADSVAGVAFCEMCWKLTKPRAKHRFWSK